MRVKRGVTAHRRHKKVKKATKGMIHSRRSSYRLGKQAVIKALQYAYRDRRNRKREMRKLWIIRINAAAREHGLTYSQLIKRLSEANIKIDRRTLAQLAVEEPKTFESIIKEAKNKS